MWSTAVLLALSIGASASKQSSIQPRGHDECGWRFYAESEHVNGAVTQIGDGQIQIHEYESKDSCYTFHFKDGKMIDSNGFGCVVAEPQKQIQCNSGDPGT